MLRRSNNCRYNPSVLRQVAPKQAYPKKLMIKEQVAALQAGHGNRDMSKALLVC
jgi:hypothetical protein